MSVLFVLDLEEECDNEDNSLVHIQSEKNRNLPSLEKEWFNQCEFVSYNTQTWSMVVVEDFPQNFKQNNSKNTELTSQKTFPGYNLFHYFKEACTGR